jgi:hypothetical protein
MTLEALVTGSISLAGAYLSAKCVAPVLPALRAGGRRAGVPDSLSPRTSRLTTPVSLIVPAGLTSDLDSVIRNFLGLDYPELELIVLVDRPAPAVDAIASEWKLESIEFFYRRAIDTAPVRRILRSLRDERLLVVEKEPDHACDAWNVGVNLARYRFIGIVPPGISCRSDALLRAMTPVLLDPGAVVGVGCQVDTRSAADDSLENCFDYLRSARALMSARLSQHARGGAFDESDLVRFWRRDAVLATGGFSADAGHPARDMMRRIKVESPGRVVRSAEIFGHVSGFIVSSEPTHGAIFGSSRLDRAAICCLFFGSLTAAAGGWMSWVGAASVLLVLCTSQALVSSAALLMAGSQTVPCEGPSLPRLILASFLEVLVEQPRRICASLAAGRRAIIGI